MPPKKDDIAKYVSYDQKTGYIVWTAKTGRKTVVGKHVGSEHSGGYLEMSINGFRLFAHQVAWLLMTGEWPEWQIDHINGDRKDNRWENLRRAEQRLNSANMKRRPNNKSGRKGVVQTKSGNWQAFIHIDGKTKSLGTYTCREVAHRACVMAARFAWADYARSG